MLSARLPTIRRKDDAIPLPAEAGSPLARNLMAVVGLGPEGTMQLTASDIVSLYRPTPCSLRLYLREQGVAESEPSAFDQIIQTLGTVHEQKHLATLELYEDISKVERERRVSRTLEAIRNRVPVIFQAEFEYATT